MDQLRAYCAAAWRQLGRSYVVARRAVPRDGLRATDLVREPVRHRGQPVGQCQQAVCDGRSLGGQSLGVNLDNTVYALDSRTIDLRLSLFD